ncbi:hypothetical protein ES703_72737 [subsurface metagenome]
MEKGLITANTWFGITFQEFRRVHLAKLRFRFRIPETGFGETLEPVPAFVNKGNWLVVCPKCAGAEYALEKGWFFCCSCKHSYMGHKYRRLVFPTNRARIEELLIIRPLENRNWTPNETVEDLERENKEHAAELLTAAEGG